MMARKARIPTKIIQISKSCCAGRGCLEVVITEEPVMVSWLLFIVDAYASVYHVKVL